MRILVLVIVIASAAPANFAIYQNVMDKIDARSRDRAHTQSTNLIDFAHRAFHFGGLKPAAIYYVGTVCVIVSKTPSRMVCKSVQKPIVQSRLSITFNYRQPHPIYSMKCETGMCVCVHLVDELSPEAPSF